MISNYKTLSRYLLVSLVYDTQPCTSQVNPALGPGHTTGPGPPCPLLHLSVLYFLDRPVVTPMYTTSL